MSFIVFGLLKINEFVTFSVHSFVINYAIKM